MERTWSGEWVTRRMVRPSRWNSFTRSMHLRWKRSSPTASTSSIDQDVGVHVDGHGEAEPDVHARGVELDLPVDELLELGEVDDVVEDPVDLLLGHARAATRSGRCSPARSGPAGSRRPSSSSPASFPRTTTSPAVGWSTPQMHLSSVDLPEPLRPRIPTVSPFVDLERDVLERPEVLVRGPPAVDDALLERVVAPVGQPEALGHAPDVDRDLAHLLELLGEVALEAAEDGQRDQEEDDRQGEDAHVQRGVPEVPVVWAAPSRWSATPLTLATGETLL